MAREIKPIDQLLEQYSSGQLDIGSMSNDELHLCQSIITASWHDEEIQDPCIRIGFLIEEELHNRKDAEETPDTTLISRITNWSKSKFRRL